MTSLESSAKTKNHNPFWINLKNNLKNHIAFPIQIAIFLGLMYPLTAWEVISARISTEMMPISNAEKYNIAKDFKYILTSTEGVFSFAFLLSFGLLFAGVLLGISKFRFMFKKSSVNVYFSLGITRTKLFVSTYLAGAIQLLLSVFVPMIMVFFINLKFFGFSKEMFLSVLFLLVGYFAIALFGFTVSSVVASAAGTMTETFLFSTIFVFLPNIILGCVQQLMSLFVLGNEYDFKNTSLDYYNNLSAHSLFEKFSYLIPSNFFNEKIALYHILSRDKKAVSADTGFYYNTADTANWTPTSFALPIGWIAVSLVGFAIGIYIINKRRNETAGFIGSNKTMNFVSTFIICFSAFCLSTAIFTEFNSLLISTLLSALVFVIIYFIIELVLTRKVKLLIKGIRKLPVQLGLLFVILLVFSTGLFGYSTRVPLISDVEKVSVSVPFGNSVGLNLSTTDLGDELSLSEQGNLLKSITSQKDLETVTNIHKQFIADGKLHSISDTTNISDDSVVECDLYIKYTLKNGKTITRYYKKAKVSTFIKTLEIEKTQKYEERLNAIFNEPISKKDKEDIQILKTIIQGENSSIYMLSNHLDVKEPLSLDKNKRLEFLDCISKDIKNQTVLERYSPNSQLIGVVAFVNNENFSEEEKYYNNSDFEEASTMDKRLILDPNNINLNRILFSPYHEHHFFVFITQDMKNTIKFIEDNALLKYFDNSSKIVSAQIIDKKVLIEKNPWLTLNNQIFTGCKITKDPHNPYAYEDYSSFKNSYLTKDVATITHLELNSYYQHFAPSNEYFVRYNLDDGSKIIMIVPENKVPEHIKNAVAKISLKDIS